MELNLSLEVPSLETALNLSDDDCRKIWRTRKSTDNEQEWHLHFIRYLIAAESVKDIALALRPRFHLKCVKICPDEIGMSVDNKQGKHIYSAGTKLGVSSMRRATKAMGSDIICSHHTTWRQFW